MKNVFIAAASLSLMISSQAMAQEPEVNTDDLSGIAAEQWMGLYPKASEKDARRATSAELDQSIQRAKTCLKNSGLGGDRDGGVYLNQRGNLDIVFRIKKLGGQNENRKIKACLDEPDFRAVRSRFGITELVDAQRAVSDALETAGIPAGSELEIAKDRILVVVSEEDFHSAKQIVLNLRKEHKSLKLRKGQVEQSVPTAAIYGHFPTLDCTTGYAVRHTTTGRNGISTAGHCGDADYRYSNSSLQVLQPGQLDYVFDTDLQWYSSEGTGEVPDTYYPYVADTLASASAFGVYGTRTSNLLTGNSVVCKDGRITGSTCGIFKGWANVRSKDGSRTARLPYAEITNATSLQQFASEGDSGGPVYLYEGPGYVALGGVSARSNTINGRMYFSPVETYQNLNLQILTLP